MRSPPTALVAAVIGLVATPALMLADVPELRTIALAGFAVAVAAIAAVAVLAIRVPSALLGLSLIGPALVLGIVARRVAEDHVIASPSIHGPGVLGAVLLAAIVAVLAWAGARLGEAAQQLSWARATARVLANMTLGLAIVGAAIVALRGEPPTAVEWLAARAPDQTLGVMVDDGLQSARIARYLEVRRTCDQNFCDLVVHIDHGDGYQVGSRRPLGDEIDRAPLGIVALPELVIVLPQTGGGLDWSRAMAFSRTTAHFADVRSTDLGVPVAPPIAWRLAALIGTVLALVLALACARARWALRLMRRAIDGTADADGILRLTDGTIARPDEAVTPGGAYFVLAVDPSIASYRTDGIAAARGVVPGNVAAHVRLHAERIAALDLTTLGVLAITHAPLVAAWAAGYAVLGT